MSNVISLSFHRTKRACKDEIIDLKNKYLRMDIFSRAARRTHVERQLEKAPLSPYFILLKQAYTEVDNDAR